MLKAARSKSKVEVKERPVSVSSAPKDSKINCLVAKGTTIEGNFSCAENVRMEGIIKGEVSCDAKFVMGEDSRVEGQIKVAEALIMGRIKGELSVSGVLHLTATARIEGTIRAQQMVVEEGASYNGECHIGSW